MKTILTLLVLLGLVTGGTMYYKKVAAVQEETFFRTAPIERGNLYCTKPASGTIEPEELIDIGAQVAGIITDFGKDVDGKSIDYNSVVEENMVLAYIDQKTYQAALDQANAALAKSKADLLQYKAKLLQAEQDWKRAQALRPKEAIAETDYDTAKANFTIAEANIAVAEAVIKQNEASLRVAQANFDYTTIRSPVSGTVISRRVNKGQTVVASLNTPSLFLIAKDLRRMQVWASVNEADIGRIHVDTPARFTVDTYPDDVFRGKVSQVRMNATMTQNVVNYTVVVTADNPDGKLLPYMTASVKFEVDNLTNVLKVPNSALRWKPKPSQIAPDAVKKVSEKPDANSPDKKKEPSYLWVEDGDYVRPIEVTVGPNDGAYTQVIGAGVEAGKRVVIGEGGPDDDAGGSDDKPSNPFLPKFHKRSKKASGPPH